MDFVQFLQSILFNFPTTKEGFFENPYPIILLLVIISMILKGKIGFLFYFILSLLIFLAGLYYGIVNPYSSNIVGILIFSFCSLVSLGLLLYKIFVKSS